MTIAYRSLIALAIAAALAGCDTDVEPTVPKPDKPEPLVPAPAETFTTQIGDVMITATKEELVITSNTEDDKLASVESFKGIKFADAERFEHSDIVDLEGDIDATAFGDACPQLKTVSQIQSEDCLNLNIWRPVGVDADADLPVYVFIHGGDFEYGSGAEPLIQGDTVVAQGADEGNPFIYVTFNYRLGLLGSMWVDHEMGGNFGIGDQKRAMQWVNKNIDKFGGSTENVTLMGQGSGAMSVGILQQNDSKEPIAGEGGYFKRSIMQSNPYGFEYTSYKSAEKNSVSICEATKSAKTELADNSTKETLQDIMNAVPALEDILAPIVKLMPDEIETTFCLDDSLDVQKKLLLSEILDAQGTVLSNPLNKTLNWVSESLLTLMNGSVFLPSSTINDTPMANLLPFAPYNEHRRKPLCINDCELGYHFVSQPALNDLSVPTVIGNNEKESNTMSMLPTLTFLIQTILEVLPEDIDDGSFESISEDNRAVELAVWLQVDGNKQRVIDMVAAMSAEEIQAKIALDDDEIYAYDIVTQVFFGLGNSEMNNALLELEDYKPQSEKLLGGATQNMSEFKMLMNDMLFQAPARNQAIRSTENADVYAPVSMYHFAFKPSFNVWTYNTQGEDGDLDIGDLLKTFACISGACGGSELPFVFNKPYKLDGSEVSLSSKDQALMNDMSRLWFSDNLFTDYEYSQQQDNVLFVDGDGQITIEDDWDALFNESEDGSMPNGRLQGLNDLGLTLKYMPDYEVPNQN
ncbi:carboxylesterase family protein [Vibrio sp. F13]|uniref:carboxylesterase family protein n=1 Tax=Vibrio sp. F13 TaxID=2070777 RepID=UPI0010BE0B2E|nr:carboxylesterase family protein [Vibrio sp. F13]TKG00016.1 carboxylesterase/lipase family protein [Vibrio sp. F13]